MALERALTLYGEPGRNKGVFPELYFFDCHSCHRQISDDPKARPQWQANPGRPIPSGTPPFNDKNMIMLSAAAKVVAPGLAGRLADHHHRRLRRGGRGRGNRRRGGGRRRRRLRDRVGGCRGGRNRDR